MNRRILVSCLVLIVAICLVLSLVSIFGAGMLFWKSVPFWGDSQTQGSPATQNPSPSPQSELSPTIDPDSPEAAPLPESAIDPEIIAQMELIQRQVIQERGLQPNGDFTRVLFTPNQLRQHVLDDFLKDYTSDDAQNDAITLAAFGLLDPGFDMYGFYVDLLSEQVAGFYDNEIKEMVVVQGEGFGGPERLTYAHEYTHALQDQNYDIENGLNYSDQACEDDSERCAAIQALLEGDASLSELNWFYNHATTQDQAEIFSYYDSYESPVLDSAPAFISKDFLFPYEEGFDFVQNLYDHGGWDAVDQAYIELPVSTEQIMHPERYPDDKPIPVSLPDASTILGEGWEEIDQGVMGEWYTYLILSYGLDEDAQLAEEDAAEAAEGWGGDSYSVYYHPKDQTSVIVLSTLWESSLQADEFARAFREYASDRFGSPIDRQSGYFSWQDDDKEYHTLHVDGPRTIWILAPNAILAEAIWNAVKSEQ